MRRSGTGRKSLVTAINQKLSRERRVVTKEPKTRAKSLWYARPNWKNSPVISGATVEWPKAPAPRPKSA